MENEEVISEEDLHISASTSAVNDVSDEQNDTTNEDNNGAMGMENAEKDDENNKNINSSNHPNSAMENSGEEEESETAEAERKVRLQREASVRDAHDRFKSIL
eukprot:12018480-Ditylum_brightwellii.AAC.1